MTSSMAEIIAVLNAAIDAYTRRHHELLAAVDKTRQVLARFTAVTTGSTHPAPRDARQALEQSRNELEESAANAAETVRLLTSYLASMEGSGGGTGNTQAPPQTTAAPAASQSDRTKLPPFNARDYLDALPAMEPKKQRKRGQKTRGTWIVDGEDDQELISGDGSDADKAEAHWARIRRSDEPSGLTIYGDVEPKFAMQMRDESVTQARIVINNPDGPCGYGKGWQYGCDALLPRFLAPGSRLTVVWPGPTEKTYTGQPEGDQE